MTTRHWTRKHPAGPPSDPAESEDSLNTEELTKAFNDETRGLEYAQLLHDGNNVLTTVDPPSPSDDGLGALKFKDVANQQEQDRTAYGPMGVNQNLTGFTPEALVLGGCLYWDGFKPNNLKGVHQIFDYRCWKGISSQVYTYVLPALRLATKFLTHAGLHKFWLTMLGGDRIFTENRARAGVIFGRPGYKYHTIPKFREVNVHTHQDMLRYFEWFGKHTQAITYGFASKKYPHLAPDGDSHAVAIAVHHTDVEDSPHAVPWEQSPAGKKPLLHVHVSISNEYLKEILGMMKLKFPDEQRIHRFYLLFAVTLCHELAHAFVLIDQNYHRKSDHPFLRPEPGMLGDTKYGPEPGWVWERVVFGGLIHGVNHTMSCRYGLALLDEHLNSDDPEYPDAQVWAIPMKYVSWIQQEETWNDMHDCSPEKSKKLLIDKTDCQVGMRDLLVTTTGLAEFRRVEVEGPLVLGEHKTNDELVLDIERMMRDQDRQQLKALDPQDYILNEFRRTKQIGKVTLIRATRENNPGMSDLEIEQLNRNASTVYEQQVEAWRLAKNIVVFEEAMVALAQAEEDEDKEVVQKILEQYETLQGGDLQTWLAPPERFRTPTPEDPILQLIDPRLLNPSPSPSSSSSANVTLHQPTSEGMIQTTVADANPLLGVGGSTAVFPSILPRYPTIPTTMFDEPPWSLPPPPPALMPYDPLDVISQDMWGPPELQAAMGGFDGVQQVGNGQQASNDQQSGDYQQFGNDQQAGSSQQSGSGQQFGNNLPADLSHRNLEQLVHQALDEPVQDLLDPIWQFIDRSVFEANTTDPTSATTAGDPAASAPTTTTTTAPPLTYPIEQDLTSFVPASDPAPPIVGWDTALDIPNPPSKTNVNMTDVDDPPISFVPEIEYSESVYTEPESEPEYPDPSIATAPPVPYPTIEPPTPPPQVSTGPSVGQGQSPGQSGSEDRSESQVEIGQDRASDPDYIPTQSSGNGSTSS